eukprot:TRINITY_DN19646_c0_g1_i1.p1 TRINITY_DN19646_c0_g1~~TRINITY_DN19646_c0_g1_i1.p1  ORF type:complete len:383 (-),score=42.71 TRINITY_DN19646_c0_g1_i1:8-1156(-)
MPESENNSRPVTPTRDSRIENHNVVSEDVIITPFQLKSEIPMGEEAAKTVSQGQATVQAILNGNDHRLLVVVGPCSIHDPVAAVDYARRLRDLAVEVSDTLYLVMRVYFEKPRTTIGWKGLLNDPDLDDSCDIEKGLRVGRQLMSDISDLGLPIAGEALDLVTPQYVQEFLSWTAIGARTTESQTHRSMASAFTSAVGFKNATSGQVDVAINAIKACISPHVFLSTHLTGQVCVVRTRGNAHTHVILRGGDNGPNYDAESILRCELALTKAGLPLDIMVDCSHGNSGKNPDNQPAVLTDIAQQIVAGNKSVFGVMVESNICSGTQALPKDKVGISQLRYGVSITDACIGWDETVGAVRTLAQQLRPVLQTRKRSSFRLPKVA